jgi:hypothetical protein
MQSRIQRESDTPAWAAWIAASFASACVRQDETGTLATSSNGRGRGPGFRHRRIVGGFSCGVSMFTGLVFLVNSFLAGIAIPAINHQRNNYLPSNYTKKV